MIWGGIGPGGYRTKLIKCDGHITSQKYVSLHGENHILEKINQAFPNGFIC